MSDELIRYCCSCQSVGEVDHRSVSCCPDAPGSVGYVSARFASRLAREFEAVRNGAFSAGAALAKREAVAEYHNVAQRLYELLDNVDTADDMAKSDDKLYRSIVRHEIGKRWPLVHQCDGHTVVLVDDAMLAASQQAEKGDGP